MLRQNSCSVANVRVNVPSAAHVRCLALPTGCRRPAGGGERVGLKVEFLLQDSGEDELGSDDGD